MMASEHAIVAPVVLPLLSGALLLALERFAPRSVRPMALAATLGFVALACLLLLRADTGRIEVYLLGNWAAPFGIVFVLDRLSALMLALLAFVALMSLIWSLAGEDREGAHFHALFQFQLMGLSGAFLTGDLFNLFVFFEVLLIASYGLLLHGGRGARLRAAVHYVAFNLAGSALFLIAVTMLYAVTGTLNMADMAEKLARLQGTPASVAQVGMSLLLVVFAIKAALLPLYFWLPETYGSATSGVAALFAIMTKVGIYALARVNTLMLGPEAGELSHWASSVLPWVAAATLVVAAIGALAAPRLRVLVAYGIVASAGLLMIGYGKASAGTITAASLYLLNTTLVAAALFMLASWVRRCRDEASDRCTAQHDYPHRLRLAAWFFLLAIAATGLPPLASFLAKAMLLQALGSLSQGLGFWALVLVSSLLLVIAFARMGITLFWETQAGKAKATETHTSPPVTALTYPLPERLALLLAAFAIVALSPAAGIVTRYHAAMAEQMLNRTAYVEAVRGKTPAPPAWDIRKEMRDRGGK